MSPEEFFSRPKFKERFDFQMKIFRTLIDKKQDQAQIKHQINAFSQLCFERVQEEDMRLHMHLEIYRTLSYYGEIYQSRETFQNIIKSIESKNLKERLFTKKPARSFLIYGEALLKYYGFENEKNQGWFTNEGFEIIRKAKFYLLKAYSQTIEGKNKLSEEDFNYCLVLLSGCFMHLSRWFEPIFYLQVLKSRDFSDLNQDYLNAVNLEALKEKTCLDYNGQLLLKILDYTNNVIGDQNVNVRQSDHAKEIQAKCSEDIKKAKFSIENLRKHSNKIKQSKTRRNSYFKYCIEHQLFLNEHSFFCSCGRSIGDSLEIKTQHTHTQIDWVFKFEKLLDVIIYDFSTARHNLYQSESALPSSYYKKIRTKANSIQMQKFAHLKNAFKICYSILDQICYGIFEVMEMDIENDKRKISDRVEKDTSIYFLNMWDRFAFSVEDYRSNLYLISLHSIARDLDKSDYSALNSFKDYRNAMEHRIFFVGDNKVQNPTGFQKSVSVSKQELLIRTKLLMVLTKSAIFSFTYLVRRQSKIKELSMAIKSD